MTDNVAILDGYTEGYMGYQPMFDAFFLVRPGTDMKGSFKAWNSDLQEFVHVAGPLWTFERTAD